MRSEFKSSYKNCIVTENSVCYQNSTTGILPKWYSVLEELRLHARMMPRDVTTHWDSTFDMLDFTIDYRLALVKVTDDHDMNLRKFELDEEDWKIATYLCDVLKVRPSFSAVST